MRMMFLCIDCDTWLFTGYVPSVVIAWIRSEFIRYFAIDQLIAT